MARHEEASEKPAPVTVANIENPTEEEVLDQYGGGWGGAGAQVFEVTNLLIPSGTDFTEPMEIGRFGLTNAQMIIGGLVTMRYAVVGDSYESISIFVAPVARRTPAKSGYLHTGFYSAGSDQFFTPPDGGATEGFGYFHLQDPVPTPPTKLWDNSSEQSTLAPSTEVLDVAVDFGVYLSPLTDANPDNTTYQDITVESAGAKLLII